MERSFENVISFEKYLESIENLSESSEIVDGNLALDTSCDFQEIEEDSIEFEEPKVKKLVIMKTEEKIFMGCWQGCNEDNGGDGC